MVKSTISRLFLAFFFVSLFFCPEGNAQTLRGTIRQKDNNNLPPNTVIQFAAFGGQVFEVSPDANGQFRLDSLPIGMGVLMATATNFVPFTLREVEIVAGKERIAFILMTEGLLEAAAAPVDIIEARPLREVMPIGEIPLSRTQTLYHPMTYYDPARLAMASPGVAQTDDGTNSMSIRGNNPALVRWKLNGLDIVAPNHLPNAGTFSDRATASSGGVMMISAQMLDNSSLITGSGTTGYNDGIGGIMDLNLRKGNDQKREQTVQAGLVGLDIAVEGPLSRKHRGSSYLLNYRYSTVGVLGQLGVTFGGEKINFQDIAMHLYFAGKKRNGWSVFALGGKSENRFSRPDSATVFKDLFNINFGSRTGIIGVNYFGYSGKTFSSKSGISVSFQDNDREQLGVSSVFSSRYQQEVRFSANSSMRKRINPSTSLVWGGNLSMTTYYDIDNKEFNRDNVIDGNGAFQLWLAGETTLLNGALKLHYGVNPIATLYGGKSIDPRIQIFWKPGQAHQLVFSLASYSQMTPIWMMRSGNGIMRSSIYSARYNWTGWSKWVLSAETFYQSISSIPISGDTPSTYSAVNQSESEQLPFNLINEGDAQNTGLELMALRRLYNGWFVNANLTLLNSNYRGADQIRRSTRWDVGQIANLTMGKEWHRRTKHRQSARIFGVSGRAVGMGGQRTAPIDLAQSAVQGRTILDQTQGFSGRNPAYFRVDGRIYWKKSVANHRNSTIALEFQNLTNRKNIAYLYYDALTKQVSTKYQLGLIPNLSWRLEL